MKIDFRHSRSRMGLAVFLGWSLLATCAWAADPNEALYINQDGTVSIGGDQTVNGDQTVKGKLQADSIKANTMSTTTLSVSKLQITGRLVGSYMEVWDKSTSDPWKCQKTGVGQCDGLTGSCPSGTTTEQVTNHYCNAYPLGEGYCYLYFCYTQ